MYCRSVLQAGHLPLHHYGISVKLRTCLPLNMKDIRVNVSSLSSPALLWLCAGSAVSEARHVGPETETRLQTGAAYC